MSKPKNVFARAQETVGKLTGKGGQDEIVELTSRGSLTNALEELDPTIEAEGIAQNFDAFERMLIAAELTTRSVPEYGILASKLSDVESVFGNARLAESTVTRAIIQEVMSRAQRKQAAGAVRGNAMLSNADQVYGTFQNPANYGASPNLPKLEPAIKLADVLASQEGIDGTTVEPFYLNDIAENEEVQARIAEGAEIPAVEITNKNRIIRLKKTGIRVDATYEVIRRSPIDKIAYVFQRIDIRTDSRKLAQALATAIAGDGNTGTAATNYPLTTLDPSTTAGTLTLRAYLAFKELFENPFTLTHIFAQKANILNLRLLNTGSANIPLALAGGAFAQQFVSMNDKLGDAVRVGGINTIPANLLLGIDGRVALKRWYENGSTIREVDTWIREQKKSFVMSENEAYQVEEPDAVKTLQLNA